MKYEDVDLVSLKQMLKEGIPGRLIKAALGVSISEQVCYAHAWKIRRKRGRPAKVAA
jgi:hypothetical protein